MMEEELLGMLLGRKEKDGKRNKNEIKDMEHQNELSHTTRVADRQLLSLFQSSY